MGCPRNERVGIFDGLQQTVGHLGGGLVEVGVDAGDYQIHLFEHGIGKIERAIGEDVDFDSGEDADAVDFVVGGANALDVFDGTLVVEAVGEGQIL